MARTLTKLSKGGNPLVRPDDVEANIDGALAQSATVVSNRLAVRDRKSPDFIRSETLVHLIRRAIEADDQPTLTRVVPVLLERCERQIQNIFLGNSIDRRSFCQEVLSAFSELLASDRMGTGTLDFYECRFDRAFRFFGIDMRDSERARAGRNVHLPEEREAHVSREIERAVVAAVDFGTPDDQVASRELLHAIDQLPHDERRALVLVKLFGYDAESEDQEKATAATLCGVSGRTIRARLSKATAKLSQFKPEKDAQ